MKWESGRTTTKGEGFDVETIHLTDEAKKRMTLSRDASERLRDYRPSDHSRMPWFDRIVWSVVGGIAVVAIVTIGYLVWANVFGGA